MVKLAADRLFGPDRFYLDIKKRIARRGGRTNIPDGYIVDLTSAREPRLYVVENELARHEHLKHIAAQILEFSLAVETSPRQVKKIVKEALRDHAIAFERCERFAKENGFENVDLFLERLIYDSDSFSALVIIDEVSEDLEQALVSRFRFPVDIITLRRFRDSGGKHIYEFVPFLADLATGERETEGPSIDPSEIDTVGVPAQDEGFEETFLGGNRWYKIRIHSSMIPRIKHIAAYRVAPTSAITHVAEVASIEPWKDSNKYVLNFAGAARKIGPIKLLSDGRVKAPQSLRYASLSRLGSASNLDEAFD